MQRFPVPFSLAALLIVLAVESPAHADQNGYLPQSELAPIYHPTAQVYLRKDAAAAWNAFRQYCLARGVEMYPNGPNSAYRTWSQQVLMKRLYGRNAATPGTSNHGLGLAVDVATHEMRHAIDQWGAQFGWSKTWSDASWEWWHIKYQPGHYHGGDPGIGSANPPSDGLPLPVTGSSDGSTTSGDPTTSDPGSTAPVSSADAPPPSATTGIANMIAHPTVRRGSSGDDVRELQKELKARGYSVTVDGDFGAATERAVRRFQQQNGLKVDGVVGPGTWHSLADKS